MKLPFDFNTWYSMSVLHLWIVFVRLRREGQAGQDLSQTLFDNFWTDAERRMISMKVFCSHTLFVLL